MPRLAREIKSHLDKARESAFLAVETYNRPGTRFRSGGYIVLMCIAWTALLHAIFFRRKIKPFYRKRDSPRRYVRIDGDKKAWELSTCVEEYWGTNHPPERANLEFFVKLRNKIEHRSMPALDIRIFGECQALLFNFEDILTREFGGQYAINESLSLALQFSSIRSDQQEKAIKRLHKGLAKDVTEYIEAFRSSLGVDLLHDLRFSYKVFLIPKLANHADSADVAVEFVKYDPSKPAEMASYDRIVSAIKASAVPVANQGRLLAGEVCKKVGERYTALTGKRINFNASYHHHRATLYYGIRQEKGKGDPRKTNAKYCQYDSAHSDYVYTDAWVELLALELTKEGQLAEILKGRKPPGPDTAPPGAALADAALARRTAPQILPPVEPATPSETVQ